MHEEPNDCRPPLPPAAHAACLVRSRYGALARPLLRPQRADDEGRRRLRPIELDALPRDRRDGLAAPLSALPHPHAPARRVGGAAPRLSCPPLRPARGVPRSAT